MGGRVSALSRRVAGGAARTPGPAGVPAAAQPHIHPESQDLSSLPPRAVAQDFAKWQKIQQHRIEQEKSHTQRMLEEQRKEISLKAAHAVSSPSSSIPSSTSASSTQETTSENVNQPITLENFYEGKQESQNVRGGYVDEMDDQEFQQALKKFSASMPLQSQVPESVEFNRQMDTRTKVVNEVGLLHWENWIEILQLHNYNPKKWTVEKLAEEFKVDPVDLGHALEYTMLPFLAYSTKQVTAHWQTEISTSTPRSGFVGERK